MSPEIWCMLGDAEKIARRMCPEAIVIRGDWRHTQYSNMVTSIIAVNRSL